MSTQVSMKFTLQGTTKSKTQTLSQIRTTTNSIIQPKTQSRFSMGNVGRTPCMQFNKPSVHVDCGCAGGKRLNI